MTPDERAAALTMDVDDAKEIAAAIRAAVEEERDACAAICESGRDEISTIDNAKNLRRCAHLIRTRSKLAVRTALHMGVALPSALGAPDHVEMDRQTWEAVTLARGTLAGESGPLDAASLYSLRVHWSDVPIGVVRVVWATGATRDLKVPDGGPTLAELHVHLRDWQAPRLPFGDPRDLLGPTRKQVRQHMLERVSRGGPGPDAFVEDRVHVDDITQPPPDDDDTDA